LRTLTELKEAQRILVAKHGEARARQIRAHDKARAATGELVVASRASAQIRAEIRTTERLIGEETKRAKQRVRK
jgi:microcompartment protein CcmK/EutM